MQTFLLWRLGSDPRSHDREVEEVGARLRAYSKAMFGKVLTPLMLRRGGYALLALDMPVVGWIPSPYVVNQERWVLSIDFPVDADRVFTADDGDADIPYLVRFTRALERDPLGSLRRVSPPFALIWGDERDDRIVVQNDSIGFCQLLEYDRGQHHAITNRPLVLRALGIELEPEPVEWAARSLTGWFPLDRTGFRNVRYLAPATRLELTPTGVERTSFPVIRELIAPRGISEAAAIELAAASIREHSVAAARFWKHAVVAFSGGRDSRALVASMIAASARFDSLRTHGRDSNAEMILARHLAKVAGIPHLAQLERGFPPTTPQLLARSLHTAARWQLGLMENKAHKIFNMRHPTIGAGKVNVMGKHGEIARGYYYSKVGKQKGGVTNWKASLLEYQTSANRDLLRDDVREGAIELIARSIEEVASFGVSGHAALDLFYLHERTRRWASGTIYNQPNKVVTPFFNPDYITAAFHLSPETKQSCAMQRGIVEASMPVWRDVPYLVDRGVKKWCRAHTPVLRRLWVAIDTRLERFKNAGRSAYLDPEGSRYAFDNVAYWRTVGAELIATSLERSDLVNAVFDATKLATRWPKEPDVLAVAATVERVSRDPLEPDDHSNRTT